VTSGERPTHRVRRASEPRFDRSTVARWIGAYADEIAAARDFLTQLDAATGDADHGVNMDRGVSAAMSVFAADADLPPGDLLAEVGSTIVLRVGGAAGPLYGTAFREMGLSLGSRARFGLDDLVQALQAGLDGIVKLGAATEGDKTMVDAWSPAVDALHRDGTKDVGGAFREARKAAEAGAAATVPMQARKGRASYLGPRSVGHQDPGATSSALLFVALERAVGGTR
jgi:dihydroxyacetone kinase-like protein